MPPKTRRSPNPVSSGEFYGEYHGHKTRHLAEVLTVMQRKATPIIWTAGDSSLDNKYWVGETAPSVGAYTEVLEPLHRATQDLTYWLNKLSEERGMDVQAINTAVEATTLNSRTYALQSQDKFLRDNIREQDTLIVSVGGNDIAMAPTPCTVLNMLGLICCVPTHWIEHGFGRPLPCDDYCCGCGSGCLSNAGACPPGVGYFLHLFHTRLECYIRKLVAKTKPKRIIICCIYYPDMNPGDSWADATLKLLGYNKNPKKLQLLTRRIYEEAITKVQVPGCEVVYFPMFETLDGSDTHDYVARVEPSAAGGKKLAAALLDRIDRDGSAAAPNSMGSL